MSNAVSTLLSASAPLALMVILWVMAQISRRFGEVTHRPPLYRGFYVALGLMFFPLVVRLLSIGQSEPKLRESGHNSLGALAHDIPLAVGITLAVVIAWRYWGWLVYAREGQTPTGPRQPDR
ncbi:MAG: hypothetical protein HY866_11540 [Chloroflexi bacterium]|nr:hypothetical protein [Chloroflexota bacterium]